MVPRTEETTIDSVRLRWVRTAGCLDERAGLCDPRIARGRAGVEVPPTSMISVEGVVTMNALRR